MLVPPEARSRGRLCRQFGCGYIVPNREDRALPVPARSRAQLLAWLRARRLFATGE